ncbi:MAG: low-density lipoprotein receptor class A repeat-containing protein [Candidatus Poseidoniaceae archaeon]
MDKAIAICLTALLLLAGCLSSEDDDVISIVGCDNENALNYDENVTESGLCALEDDLEAGIVSFVNLMDDGPDMDNITSTIGYSMEVSSVMGDETWHYMETMVVTPDGMKVTIEDNYGEETMISDMIVSGSEVQYSFNNGTSDYQVRMSHEGTTLEAFDAMMNMGLDMDMDMGDDMDSGEMFVCDNGEEIPAAWVNDGEEDCYDGSDENGTEGRQTVSNDDHDDHDDHDDGMDMDMDEDENPESGDYTGYFNPVTATFSGFEVTDEGMVFSGLLNVEDAPFGALEVYTTSDFTVTGFSMMDVNDENNWVKFVLINSGETVVDNTLPLSAIPFILLDPALFGDDEGEDMDEDMVCYDMENHEVVDIYDEMDCYDAGYMWTSMDRDEHDPDGHDEDREEDMVCYDIDTHVILEDYDNQMDCEYAGYMWVSSDSGDGHTGDNSWTFERGMEDCDSDNDTMVSYEELVACIDEDLANDGFGDMSASDVRADMMFNMSDMDNDTFLNESELSYLNSMYSSDEDRDEHHDESYDCMNVTAGEVAPENGTFTFSNGTTVDVEAG